MAKKSMIAKNLRKKGNPIQYRNRCRLCGRPRGYLRRFALCRICFRQLYHEGVIPGVRKASW